MYDIYLARSRAQTDTLNRAPHYDGFASLLDRSSRLPDTTVVVATQVTGRDVESIVFTDEDFTQLYGALEAHISYIQFIRDYTAERTDLAYQSGLSSSNVAGKELRLWDALYNIVAGQGALESGEYPKAEQSVRISGLSLSREDAVHKYLHLVKYVAGRISVNLPPNVEINDLINDGILGLIDAIEKYDDARGVKFETYAITRINGAILDALRALDWVPRAVRQRARELERVYQALEVEYGRAATEEEVAEKMGMTLKELDVLMQKIRGTSVLSLEEFLPNERGYEIPLLDTLRDDGTEVTNAVEAREVKAALVHAVDELPPQERTVISLYYFEGLTFKDIKDALNMSESRVSQIHAQAVLHLRVKLRDARLSRTLTQAIRPGTERVAKRLKLANRYSAAR